MAKEKQTHDLSFDYLREAIKKDQAEIDRRASLEFVRATQPDESKLAIWATREIERMDRRIEEQKAELLAVINKNTPYNPASPGDRDQPPPPLSKEASVALKEYQALSRLAQDNGAGGGAKATPTQKFLQALIQLGVTASDANAFAGPLTEVMKNLDISTTQRRAHFLGQVMFESDRFKRLVENFNYKNPERLDAIFSAVHGVEDARTLIARGPEASANRVYANRVGNGDDESTGDGWRYRSRGLIQTFGKFNYVKVAEGLGIPALEEPDILATPAIAAKVAGWYWESKGLNKLADQDDAAAVTQGLSRGSLSLVERINYIERARKALAAAGL